MLVPLNWTLESAKWQLLAQKAVRITFAEAFRSTLTGLAVGAAVPAQLGDTLGRITSLRSKSRLRALGAALVSNGIQFYVSILGGAVGWFGSDFSRRFSQELSLVISSLLITILLGGLLMGAFRQSLFTWRSKRPWAKKLKRSLEVARHYEAPELAVALAIGGLRYLVFVGQFALALTLFDLSLTTEQVLGGVSMVYLVKTILPAINAVGDLGVREFTALYVFEPYQLPSEKIMAATFLIWLVNILAPLLVGVFFIWKFKWSARYA